MVLNLGADFSVPEEKWKELANRMEEIATGQGVTSHIFQTNRFTKVT